MKQTSIIGMILAYADKLRFRNLFLLTLGLFVADLVVPDMIPMIDEIILALLTLLFANWKKEKTIAKDSNFTQGDVIEGEVIEGDDQK